MPEELGEKLARWDQAQSAASSKSMLSTYRTIEFRARKQPWEYDGDAHLHTDALMRLPHWIDSAANEADQKVLLILLTRLFFLSREDFTALYLTAYRLLANRWLCDQYGLNPFSPTFDTEFQAALEQTWICPVTDSAKIGDFYHINNISTRVGSYRPDWRSVAATNGIDGLVQYVTSNSISCIILIEDFIGSGIQFGKVIPIIRKLATIGIKFLIVPLIICKNGLAKIRKDTSRISNLSIKPVLQVESPAVIDSQSASHTEDGQIATILTRLEPFLKGCPESNLPSLGFEDTGALLVKFDNCPNNTIKIIHQSSPQWKALFPRANRTPALIP